MTARNFLPASQEPTRCEHCGTVGAHSCPADRDTEDTDPTVRFYVHLGTCEACHGDDDQDRFNLCADGIELLFEAGEALGEEWHPVMRRIQEKRDNEAYADMQFRYYVDSEEI